MSGTLHSGHDTDGLSAHADSDPVSNLDERAPVDQGDVTYVADPRVVETRAMDLVEIAVEVTARPDAEPADVVPARSSIDIELDPPRYADDPVGDPTGDPSGADAGDTVIDGGIDPRMAERRIAVATDIRFRRRRRALGALGFLALGAAGVGLVYSPVLDVDHVEIIGSTRLTAADLASVTGVRVGAPMVFVDPGRVAAKLRSDPRFVRVVVNRRFPSSISIRLTDRRAIALVVGPTRGVVVGEDGVIIAVARGDEFIQHIEVPEDPPTKVGSRLAAPLAAAVDVMGSMSYGVAGQITKMSITDEGELVFELGKGRTVLFGTVDDADRKLLAMTTMLGPQVDLRGVCRLDVRVPTAPTMRRDPDCATPTPTPAPAPVEPGTTAPGATDPATTPPGPVVDPTATSIPAPTPDAAGAAAATSPPTVAPPVSSDPQHG